MKEVVLITGANGMLAKQLAKELEEDYSVRFLTREVSHSNEYLWDLDRSYIDPKALLGVHSIIHLAGSSIADKRWSKKRKQVILSSRVDSAQLILDELEKKQLSIESFISASAVGYYGTKTTENTFYENDPQGDDFLSDVCHQWEGVAYDFKSKGIAKRVAILRIGIILAKNKGALEKMLLPMKFGFGSGIGGGQQYMPWIHINDLVRVFKFILDEERITGVFNAVSPHQITNIEFTKTIAEIMNKPLILPNIPQFIIKGLFGEMSVVLLEGSKVSSDKIIKAGFQFEYDKLNKALDNLIN